MKRAGSRVFRSSFKSWTSICGEVTEFLSELGRDRVIAVSHSSDHLEGVVIVWYWEALA
jgi:hypothetical protein